MEISIYEIIFAFFYIAWLLFQLYIINITIDTKQCRNVMWKIIIPSMFLGACAFLSGVCMGNLM
jgi:hypothetical protein